MEHPTLSTDEIWNKALEMLECDGEKKLDPIRYNDLIYTPRKEAIFAFCKFPGNDVYGLVRIQT